MKFLALVATASATVHDACTDTWGSKAQVPGTAPCTGDGEICFDWLDFATKTSSGLFCGLKTNCDETGGFEYTDATSGVKTQMFAQCDGLSGTACRDKDNKAIDGACDAAGKFTCADWTDDKGAVVVGCAAPTECGNKAPNGLMVACTGLLGDACMDDAGCDTNAKYRCGVEFNNQTYAFVTPQVATCHAPADCGTAMDPAKNTTIINCYGQVPTACNSTASCDKPDGDDGEVTCGYLPTLAGNDATKNTTKPAKGMCVDAKFCPDGAMNATGPGVAVKYFGKDTQLWCGSARTALAMGAAAISAYLAM